MPARLLLVDDHADTLYSLSEALKPHLQDISIETAASGVLALSALEARPFELIVSDIRMPGIDGMQLLREIRVRAPDTAVILMTAHGDELRLEALRAGASALCAKPIVVEDLLRLIRNSIQNVQLMKQVREGNRKSLPRSGRRKP
jgi:DNA-binding NtrC family response regulator